MTKLSIALFLTFAIASSQIYSEAFLDISTDDASIEALKTKNKIVAPTNKTKAFKTDILDCISDASKMIPLFTTLVTDMKAKKEYTVVVADLVMIFMNVDSLCNNCGFPKPHSPGGPIDIPACLADAEVLVNDVYLIIHAEGNILNIFKGLSQFFEHTPKSLKDCGIAI